MESDYVYGQLFSVALGRVMKYLQISYRPVRAFSSFVNEKIMFSTEQDLESSIRKQASKAG